jgi:O-antigen ligase
MRLRNSRSQSGSVWISLETLSIWLLSAALIFCYVIPSEITSVIFLTVVLIFLLPQPGALDPKTVSVLKPLLGMTMLGLVYGFSNAPVDIARDVWLTVKAVTCVLLGYMLARRVKRISRLLKQFILTALLFSLIYIVPYLLGTRELGIGQSADAASLPLATVLTLPLLLMSSNGLVHFGSKHFNRLAVIIILLTLGLSLSRTAVGCAAIMILAAFGAFDNFRRLFIYCVILVGVAFFVTNLLPSIESGDITFASKTRNSLSEVAFTDGLDPSEMLTNWRGFEAYRAYVGFAESTPLQQLVGRGLGATIDLGMIVQMSETMDFQFIPHLHNGYMHILTKYGMLGVLLYLLFLHRIIKQPLSTPPEPVQLATRRILIGMSIVLVYTTLVITGIFNKSNHDSFLIMMGVFFRIAYNLRHSTSPQLTSASTQTIIRA